jgi:hypothetical protein
MTEFVLDPTRHVRPVPRQGRVAELRAYVLREARERSEREGVELIVERARRSSDVALLWFEGDRRAVLRTVGGWDPDPAVELQIAHAGARSSHYELSLYVAVRDGETGTEPAVRPLSGRP